MSEQLGSRAAAALREEIREAFDRRRYPGDDHLALGPGSPGDDSEDVMRFFRGKDWREITLNSILEEGDLDPNAFLYFMSAEGFVFYLPAFLMESLNVDGPFDLGEPLAFRLTPPRGEPGDPGLAASRDLFSRIVAALTPEEKRAVTHVLEHLAREYDRRGDSLNLAQSALDGYWAEPVGSR